MIKNFSLSLALSVGVFLSACTVVAENSPTTYAECVAAGNKVLRTFPARCITDDGRSFVEEAAPKSICVDNCGNGQCDEIVCMGSGCPCPESAQTCPKDCKK